MEGKYVEAEFPRYFVFGEHREGLVDIATVEDSAVATVSKEQADKLVRQRDAVVQKLCDMARSYEEAAPEAFHRFWYGA